MSWEAKSAMDQKLLFIKMWQSDNYTMTTLCDRFSIINTNFKRNDLVVLKRRRLHKEGNKEPKFDPSEPNEIWSADYKGKFGIGNIEYC